MLGTQFHQLDHFNFKFCPNLGSSGLVGRPSFKRRGVAENCILSDSFVQYDKAASLSGRLSIKTPWLQLAVKVQLHEVTFMCQLCRHSYISNNFDNDHKFIL